MTPEAPNDALSAHGRGCAPAATRSRKGRALARGAQVSRQPYQRLVKKSVRTPYEQRNLRVHQYKGEGRENSLMPGNRAIPGRLRIRRAAALVHDDTGRTGGGGSCCTGTPSRASTQESRGAGKT